MTAERTNVTYTETEEGQLVIPEIVPEPTPSLPIPWPKSPEPDEPAPDKEE